MQGRAICAEQRALFIEQLKKLPNVTLAAKAAGMSTRSAYDNKKQHPGFSNDWDEALAQSVAALHEAVWNRSINGVPSYVVSQGRVVMDPADPSKPLIEYKSQDHIALSLLKAHMPEYAAPQSTGSDIPAELQPDPTPKPDEAVPDIIEE